MSADYIPSARCRMGAICGLMQGPCPWPWSACVRTRAGPRWPPGLGRCRRAPRPVWCAGCEEVGPGMPAARIAGHGRATDGLPRVALIPAHEGVLLCSYIVVSLGGREGLRAREGTDARLGRSRFVLRSRASSPPPAPRRNAWGLWTPTLASRKRRHWQQWQPPLS